MDKQEQAIAALRSLIRWNDDGPCWCELRREKAARMGRKVHMGGCQRARALFAAIKAEQLNDAFSHMVPWGENRSPIGPKG